MKTNTFFATLMLVLFCAQATVLRADELGPLYDGTNSYGSYVPLEEVTLTASSMYRLSTPRMILLIWQVKTLLP